MAIYTNSLGVAYKAFVVVDPETGQAGTAGGIVTDHGSGIWGPESFYIGIAIVDPETNTPTSYWAQSDGINGIGSETFRLFNEAENGYIVTQNNRAIKRG